MKKNNNSSPKSQKVTKTIEEYEPQLFTLYPNELIEFLGEKEAKDFYEANKDKMKQGDKQVPFEKAKEEITQFIKVEKFKAQMNKIVANLRSAAEIKVNP